MRKRFEQTLDEVVKNCNCIPNESKAIFIYHLHSSIDLFRNKITHESELAEKYGISENNDREKANVLCDKLKEGIKAAKKLKTIVANIDSGNSVLINSLNKFIDNTERNLKIEEPKKQSIGREVNQEMHALGLSFKSVWEFHSEVKVSNPEAMEIATLFFYEAGIKTRPDSPVEHNSNKSDVTKLFKDQLSGKSKVTPYLQIAKENQ